MMQMGNAAINQGVELGKAKLREFLENSEMGRQAIAMPPRDSDSISLQTLDSRGKRRTTGGMDDGDDDDMPRLRAKEL